MRVRTTFNLLALLVVLIIGLVFVKRQMGQSSVASARPSRVLRPPVREISELTWVGSNGTVRVVRKGDEWFLDRPVRARASSPSVMQLLAAVERMRAGETITLEQQSRRSLGLGVFGLAPPRAEIRVATGRDTQTMLLGDVTPMNDGLYLQEQGQTDVKVVTSELVAWFALQSSDLRDATVLQGSPTAAVRLDLQRNGKPFVQLVREDTGLWVLRQPVVGRADQSTVGRVLGTLYGLQAQAYIWDPPVTADGVDLAELQPRIEEYGLAGDEVHVRAGLWRKGEGLGQEILFGKAAPPDGVYAKRRDASAILRVPAGALDVLTMDVSEFRDRRVCVIEPARMVRLELTHGERRVVLQHATNTGWRVSEPADWRADTEAIASVLGSALAMGFSEFLPRSETNAVAGLDAPFGMTAWHLGERAPTASIELFLAGPTNDCLARLPSGEVGRIPLHQVAWVTPDLIDPLTFRDRLVLSLPRESIQRLVQYAGGGTPRRSVALGDTGIWSPEAGGGSVQPETIENILFDLSNLRALRTWTADATPEQLAEWGLAGDGERHLTIGLRGEEGIQKTLVFGRRAAVGGTFATVRGQPVVFVLPPLLVDQLMKPVVLPKTGNSEAR